MSAPPLPPGALPEGAAVESEHSLKLDPVPRVVGMARAFVAQHVPALDDDTRDTVILLTSELVTNVVIHARTTLEVTVVVTADKVVVGVQDLDLGHTEANPQDREGGRGLMLVEALAEASAMYHAPGGGKTVWFRLPRPQVVAKAADESNPPAGTGGSRG